MDLIEKKSEMAIWFTAASFALDFVLPEEYRLYEKLSYKNFLLTAVTMTGGLVLYDKVKEMLFTSRSSPSSKLPESS